MSHTGSDTTQISILYVDDEPPLLKVGRLFLERRNGIRVTTLESAYDALRELETRSYDVIISDYQMPGMDGIAFLKALRERGDSTPFIIFTGRGREEVVIEAYEEGADFYIQKGGDPGSQFAELEKKIRKAVDLHRAERAKKESEEKVRALVENAFEGILIADFSGNILFYNQSAAKIMDISHAEDLVRTRNVMEFIAPESQKDVIRDLSQVAQGIDAYLVNYQLVTDAKRSIWVECIGKRINFQGTPADLISMRDITGRIEGEKERRKNEEKYRTLVDRASQMLFLHDQYGAILDVNRKSVQCTGYSREELLSMNVTDIDPDIDNHDFIQWLWQEAPVLEELIFETRHQRKDGSIYPAEVHATRVDVAGEPCILGLAADITSRKQEEATLRENEEKLQGILNNLQDIYYRTDSEGMITMVNHSAASILGLPSADEIIGRAASDFWADPEERKKMLKRIADEENVSDYEATLRKTDGTLFPVSISSRLLFENPGNPVGVEGIIRDITRRKKAEERLRESEEKFRTLVENAFDGILIADFSGNILFCNHSAARIVDVPDPGRIIRTRNVMEFIAPDSKEGVIQDFRQVALGIDAYLVNYQLITDSDRMIWVECIGRRIEYEGISSMIISMRDITLRKEADFELETTQQRLKEAHQLAEIGVWDWIMETDSMTWSEELYVIAGRDPALPALNYKEHQPLYTPASWDRLKPAIHRTLEKGEPFRLELEMVRPDGTIRNVHALGRQSLDINGNCIGLHGAVQDITERKRISEEVQKISLYTRGLIEASLDPLVTISPEGLITDVNQATEKVTGFSRKELIGSDFADYFTDPEQAGRGYAEAFRSGFVKDYPLTIRHRSGRTTDVLYNASVYADQSGTVQGVFAAARDITERRIAEDALQTANHKLQILSSITRHDILNKIMILQAYLDLTIEEIDDPKLSAYLSEIERAGNAIHRQIEFTRTYEELGVKKASWQGIEELITRIPDCTIPVSADCGGYQVLADPMIERVFSNLMDNTTRHAEGAGRVKVQCGEQNGDLLIIWEDDGPGVPDDQKEEIFKQGVGRNTGFGLFLAREILAITGITIHETGVHGEGAKFEIRVPAGDMEDGEVR